MKFGKQIQKRQLEVPEYAASFVNYKALKKLIKKLSATPTLSPQNEPILDSQAALQANKASFFFQIERELEKVNAFYIQKEAELKIRLKTLLDKKKVLQSRPDIHRRRIAKITTLEEGFQQFASDLGRLQQFVEINGTAFSKILKKWDKTSKSKTKELYLARAVEIQPFFNPVVISELSDQATSSIQELGAWLDGDGDQTDLATSRQEHAVTSQHLLGTDEGDADTLLLDTILSGNLESLKDLLARMKTSVSTTGLSQAALGERITRAFLASIYQGSKESLDVLLATGMVDVHSEDDINERNCLHQAAIYRRPFILEYGLSQGVSVTRTDVYGRTAMHYASVHGHLDMLDLLLKTAPEAVNMTDFDNFTPLIHSIMYKRLECVERLLSYHARLDPSSDRDHIPLNIACEHGTLEIVEVLLKYSAKILPDAEGLYPQHLVARSGQAPSMLLLLRDYGADLNQVDKLYGWTPLVHAASEANVACLKTLLELGADPNIRDEKGLPAVYYATWEGHLECMRLLAADRRTQYQGQGMGNNGNGNHQHLFAGRRTPSPLVVPSQTLQNFQMESSGVSSERQLTTSLAPVAMAVDIDAIPELELPPPIIPLRRYGHNFLDTKAVVQIRFDEGDEPSLLFFHDSKYPAARLTISSKHSDLIPKNIILPFQEDTRLISFQVDNLDTFTLDFDVYPTYGARIIGKTVALPGTFRKPPVGSTSHACLPLFDPRLRSIGQIQFSTQVIKPFQGQPLEITDFETYWKATTNHQSEDHPVPVVTGSSLSGDYVRLYVQYTSDGVPVLWPTWTVGFGGISLPVNRLTVDQFLKMTENSSQRADVPLLPTFGQDRISQAHFILAHAGVRLEEALRVLPHWMHVNLQVLYPTADEEKQYYLGDAWDLNAFCDALLKVVFDHAREQRAQSMDVVRSVVFSSHNPNVCTALNWKQPNFPVFLWTNLQNFPFNNDIEMKSPEEENTETAVVEKQYRLTNSSSSSSPTARVSSHGKRIISIKEAVRIAESNNLMGLICSGQLLETIPALIESIKSHGLALVMDRSTEAIPDSTDLMTQRSLSNSPFSRPPEGVDGELKAQGILRFTQSIDMS